MAKYKCLFIGCVPQLHKMEPAVENMAYSYLLQISWLILWNIFCFFPHFIIRGQEFSQLFIRGQDFSHFIISRQDFSHLIIRGQDFSHFIISGQDFSHLFIRGQDFLQLIIRGQEFSHLIICDKIVQF